MTANELFSIHHAASEPITVWGDHRRRIFEEILSRLLIYLVGVLLLGGCTTYPLQTLSTPPQTTEDWVARGSGAFVDAGTRLFHGVGVASGIRNPLLLRSSADHNAQKEVAGIVTAFLRQLSPDAGDGTDGDPGLYALVQRIMSDAVIVDHRQDDTGGRYFALCRLTLEAVKCHLATDMALAPDKRQAMLDRADEWHARMTRF